MNKIIEKYKIDWIFAAFALAGTILNVWQIKICFVIWIVTNLFWFGFNLSKKIYSQSLLNFVYFLLAVWGLVNWR